VRELAAHSALDRQLALSADGKLLLTSTEVGQIRLYDVETGELRQQMVGHTTSPGRVSVAFLSAQKAVSAGADKVLQVWNLKTGKSLSRTQQPSRVLRLAVSSDGRRLAVCGQGDGVVLVSGVKRSGVMQLPGHDRGCAAAAFSPDGKRLVTADVGGRLHYWDLGARVRPEIRSFRVTSLCPYAVKVTPNGRSALVGDQGGMVGLHDLTTGKPLRQFETNDRTTASGVDISPDGRLAVVGGTFAVHVFELATGKELYRCPGHTWVTAAVFLPDGRRLVTSDRKAVRLWRLPDEKPELARAPAAERPKLDGKNGPGSPGWVAEFFADSALTKKAKSRIDHDFAVPGDGVPPGVQGVRWSGWLVPPVEGNYGLDVRPGAGTEFRFYQNGRALMGGPSGEYKEGQWLKGAWTIGLVLGDKPHQVRLECRNVAGPVSVTVRLRLNAPGPGRFEQKAFYHDAEQAKALRP
jgi:hypothetical protein